MLPVFQEAVACVRRRGRPRVQVVHTYRLGPHSKGDDHRPPEEIEAWRAKDPLRIARAKLSEDAWRPIENAVRDRLAQCEARVQEMPPARLVEE